MASIGTPPFPVARQVASGWFLPSSQLIARTLVSADQLLNVSQKSLAISLTLHLLVVSVLYALPDPDARRFSSSGRVEVISIEASQSPSTQEVSVEVPLDVLQTAPPTLPPESSEPTERRLSEPTFIPRARSDRPKQPRDRMRSPETAFSAVKLPRKTIPTELPRMPTRTNSQQVAKRPPVNRPAATRPKTMPLVNAPIVGVQENQQADLSNNTPPAYPAEAIRKGLEGVVMLRLIISSDGKVTDVKVIQSSGYPILDNAATNAVKQWRGQPATRWGRPVESSEVLPVRFKR